MCVLDIVESSAMRFKLKFEMTAISRGYFNQPDVTLFASSYKYEKNTPLGL